MPVDVAALTALAAKAFDGPAPGRIAVAVSGGSDSLAALHLFHQAVAGTGWQVMAVTVDHRLRPEAAAEAAAVARLCAGLGIGHATLVWAHEGVIGNVMDQARRARYRLIADWARSQGCGTIVLAHTADDQAETFLMGLSRRAGLEGLSGMRDSWVEDGVRFLRPFLGVARADLRAYLQEKGVSWVDDPSNDDPAYLRIKARRALRALAPLGITAEGLGQVVSHLHSARAALQDVTRQAAHGLVTEAAGGLVLERAGFLATPPEVQHRLINAAMLWMTGQDYPPRGAAVARLLDGLRAGRGATLGGCRFRALPQGFALTREPKAVAGQVCGLADLWDGRWRVTGTQSHAEALQGLNLRALGDDGLRLCKTWRDSGFSRDSLRVSPSIWRGAELIAAPLAGFGTGWSARICPSFDQFILSH